MPHLIFCGFALVPSVYLKFYLLPLTTSWLMFNIRNYTSIHIIRTLTRANLSRCCNTPYLLDFSDKSIDNCVSCIVAFLALTSTFNYGPSIQFLIKIIVDVGFFCCWIYCLFVWLIKLHVNWYFLYLEDKRLYKYIILRPKGIINAYGLSSLHTFPIWISSSWAKD